MPYTTPYNSKLKQNARSLRNNSSKAEVVLWMRLKGKQLLDLQFNRQKIIENYIVDFYCKSLKLAIEVDDISHDMKAEYDVKRMAILEGFGILVLRFTNQQVLKDTDMVLEVIKEFILERYGNA